MPDVNIHMVCSVKGGSGKTAYALHKVVWLATAKSAEDKKKAVLYIDADVHASETCNFLYRRFDAEKLPARTHDGCSFIRFDTLLNPADKEPKPKHYLNSFMHPYMGYYSKIEEIMLPAEICDLQFTDGIVVGASENKNQDESTSKFEVSSKHPASTVRMIFADSSPSGRAVFGNIFQTSGRASIGVGSYVSKARDLLKYVAKKRGFTDIVVDMPPGSDTFSDHLRELIVELSEDTDINLTIYYVTNDDIGHIRSSAAAAYSHLHAMRSAHIQGVCLVYNKVRLDEEKSRGLDNEKVKDIVKLLASDEGVAHELNRIEFEVFEKDETYYDSFNITKGDDAEASKLVIFGSQVTDSTRPEGNK